MHMGPCMAHTSEFDWVFPWGPGGVRRTVERPENLCFAMIASPPPSNTGELLGPALCSVGGETSQSATRAAVRKVVTSSREQMTLLLQVKKKTRTGIVTSLSWSLGSPPVVVDLNLDFVFKSHRFLLFRSQYQTFPTGDNSHDGGRISASLKVSKKIH